MKNKRILTEAEMYSKMDYRWYIDDHQIIMVANDYWGVDIEFEAHSPNGNKITHPYSYYNERAAV